MGQDFSCGCRTSAEHYFLCPYHEDMIDNDWVTMDYDDDYLNFIKNKNKKISEERKSVWKDKK